MIRQMVLWQHRPSEMALTFQAWFSLQQQHGSYVEQCTWKQKESSITNPAACPSPFEEAEREEEWDAARCSVHEGQPLLKSPRTTLKYGSIAQFLPVYFTAYIRCWELHSGQGSLTITCKQQTIRTGKTELVTRNICSFTTPRSWGAGITFSKGLNTPLMLLRLTGLSVACTFVNNYLGSSSNSSITFY